MSKTITPRNPYRSSKHFWALRAPAIACALFAQLAFAQTQTPENVEPEAADIDTQAAAPGANWVSAGGSLQGTRYSPLNEITEANVGALVEEFSVPTGASGSHQGSPLVVGSVMYIVTPFPNRLIAVDLANPPKILWTYDPRPDGASRGQTCCDSVNRGPAYARGLIVYTLLDGNVVAVNATTGREVWRTKVADPWQGETLNTAPIIVRRNVIFGSSGAEMGVRGSVRALDLLTGRPVWRAFSTGPDADVKIDATFHPFYPNDQGTDLGATTWPPDMWKIGGASSWTWITYDPILNLIFYGTSQPGVFNPTMRPGQNKWGATIFARNPDTGVAAWAYQTVPHDAWDYDATSENTVVNLRIGGVVRRVIVNFHKNGFNYIIDRATGEVISAKPFAPVNWATHIDLTTGLPNIVASKLTREGEVTSNICPSALGAKDWEWSAWSPRTRLFYFGGVNFCMSYEPFRTSYIAGTPLVGAALSFQPGEGGNMGEFVAFDPVAGRRAWTIREPFAVFGGALATAGDIVFYGTLDNKFKAVNARTGAVLLEKTLECGIVSAPIAFKGPDGRQRVAITTGVGWLNGGFATGPCPAVGALKADAQATANPKAQAAAEAVEKARQTAASITPSAATSGYVHVYKLP